MLSSQSSQTGCKPNVYYFSEIPLSQISIADIKQPDQKRCREERVYLFFLLWVKHTLSLQEVVEFREGTWKQELKHVSQISAVYRPVSPVSLAQASFLNNTGIPAHGGSTIHKELCHPTFVPNKKTVPQTCSQAIIWGNFLS